MVDQGFAYLELRVGSTNITPCGVLSTSRHTLTTHCGGDRISYKIHRFRNIRLKTPCNLISISYNRVCFGNVLVQKVSDGRIKKVVIAKEKGQR